MSRLTSAQATYKSAAEGVATVTGNVGREATSLRSSQKALKTSNNSLTEALNKLKIGYLGAKEETGNYASVVGAATSATNGFTSSLDSLNMNASQAEATAQGNVNVTENLTTKTKEATQAQEGMGEAVSKNGGAIAILDSFTGGLASQFKNAYEASTLFNISLAGMKKALIATGIGALVVALGLIIAYWDDIKDAIKGVNRELEAQEALTKSINDELERRTFIGNLDLQMQKNQEKQALLNAKIRGASEKELTEIVRQGFIDRIALAEKEAEASNKVLEDAVDADEETFKKAVKAQEDAYKALGIAKGSLSIFDLEAQVPTKPTDGAGDTEADKRKEVLEQIEALNKEHFNSLLNDKDAELESVRDKYVTLIEDAKKYGLDTIELEEQFQTELNIVKAKHQKIFDDQQDADALEKRELDREERLLLLDAELIEQAESYDARRAQIQAQTDILLEDEKATEAEKALIRAQGAKAIRDIDQEEIESKIQMVDAIGSMFTALGSISAEATEADKALAIAGAVISAGAGVASIWAAKSKAEPAVQVATKIAGSIAVVANVAKTIKQIKAVKVPNPKGTTKSGGGGANIVTPNFNVVGQSPASSSNIAEGAQAQIDRAESNPLRAYVVSTDITSQQELDRKSEDSNTIG
jgi:hypothetical protein